MGLFYQQNMLIFCTFQHYIRLIIIPFQIQKITVYTELPRMCAYYIVNFEPQHTIYKTQNY